MQRFHLPSSVKEWGNRTIEEFEAQLGLITTGSPRVRLGTESTMRTGLFHAKRNYSVHLIPRGGGRQGEPISPRTGLEFNGFTAQ